MGRTENFLDLLDIDCSRDSVIAVVGGGGKTSLIYRLAKELLHQNQKVIITTTTHMAYEPEKPFALNGEPQKIKEALEKYGYVIAAGYEAETDKFCALSGEMTEALLKWNAVVLIEADGAKKKPVKVPEEWEPVIPDFAKLVIGVVGLDCLYKPISVTACRPEKTAAFLGKEQEEMLVPEDVIRIAASFGGLRKNTENKNYLVYLNKADTSGSKELAAEMVRAIRKQKLKAAYGSLKEAEIL